MDFVVSQYNSYIILKFENFQLTIGKLRINFPYPHDNIPTIARVKHILRIQLSFFCRFPFIQPNYSRGSIRLLFIRMFCCVMDASAMKAKFPFYWFFIQIVTKKIVPSRISRKCCHFLRVRRKEVLFAYDFLCPTLLRVILSSFCVSKLLN